MRKRTCDRERPRARDETFDLQGRTRTLRLSKSVKLFSEESESFFARRELCISVLFILLFSSLFLSSNRASPSPWSSVASASAFACDLGSMPRRRSSRAPGQLSSRGRGSSSSFFLVQTRSRTVPLHFPPQRAQVAGVASLQTASVHVDELGELATHRRPDQEICSGRLDDECRGSV